MTQTIFVWYGKGSEGFESQQLTATERSSIISSQIFNLFRKLPDSMEIGLAVAKEWCPSAGLIIGVLPRPELVSPTGMRSSPWTVKCFE